MSAKAELVSYLETLPDTSTREELLYQTYFFQSVQAGLDDLKAGRTIPHEEVKLRIEEWRKSRGLPQPSGS